MAPCDDSAALLCVREKDESKLMHGTQRVTNKHNGDQTPSEGQAYIKWQKA